MRLLILPYNVELAERLYAFSIGGNDLCKYDYDGIVFATGIKNLSKDTWNKIVTELKLPQSQPFDPKQWKQLQKEQESVINKAKNVDKQIKEIQKQISPSSSSPKQKQNQKQKKKQQQQQQKQKQQKNRGKGGAGSGGGAIKQAEKRQLKQLQRIVQMEKEADKISLPTQLQKLKQRQLNTLTTLHDIASITGLDSKIVNDINKSARRESEKRLQIYLKSGQSLIAPKDYKNITPKELERRQLELLSTINKTRAKLQQLAQKKGISLDALNGVTSKVSSNVEITTENIAKLNCQFDNLFQSLAGIASTIQTTAKQYGAKLDQDQVNKFLIPNFNDLEERQNNAIAKLQYLNDQARMINPNAVQVNEEILHSSV